MICDICGKAKCDCYYVQCKRCKGFIDHGNIADNCFCEEPEIDEEEEE